MISHLDIQDYSIESLVRMTVQKCLDDVSSLDYKIEKAYPNYLLSFTIRDILDKEFELVPNYAAGGLEYFLTLQYRP